MFENYKSLGLEKIHFFLPTKSITSAIGTATRGLHFKGMNTENTVNTPQERTAILDWKKRGE